MSVYPPSDEANIRDLLKGPAKQQIKNDTDRERALIKATARMLTEIRLARKNPGAFIEFAFRTPTLGRIKLADFHKFWLERFDNAYRVQIEASKNHGKCCIGSEHVRLASLEEVSIEELWRMSAGVDILTYDVERNFYFSAKAHIADNGITPVIEARLASGRIITRTPEEPILTRRGFVPICRLLPKDAVAVAADIRDTDCYWHFVLDRWIYFAKKQPAYDTVVSVKPCGPAQTYSICVPENPVYIGNDIISHNTTNVIGYLAWKIGKNPGIRAKLFTQSAAKARQRLQVISTVVQHNKYYHLVFPDVRRDKDGPWHKTGIQVVRDNQDEKEPTLEAMGIMGSVEGGRADLVLFDDISDYRNSLLYPQIRDSLKNKVFAEILPMLDVGGRAISIATPHHQLDIIAALRHNKQWESYQFPVGKGDDPFHPLWPDVITREILQAKCEEVGLTEYNRAYRLKEIQLGQQMIKPNFIKYYTAQDLGNPYHHICVQAYDLAATMNKSSSYFTGCTLLYDKRRDLVFVADAWRDKIEVMDQASVVIRDYMKWDASLVLLEETGYQSALRKIILERLTLMDGSSPAQGLQHVLRGISPGSKSKELRLMETLPMFETNKIMFNPRLDPTIGIELSLRGDLVSQLVNFAGEKDKDMADAFAHAIKGVQSFRRETDQEENEDEWDSGDGMETRLLLV